MAGHTKRRPQLELLDLVITALLILQTFYNLKALRTAEATPFSVLKFISPFLFLPNTYFQLSIWTSFQLCLKGRFSHCFVSDFCATHVTSPILFVGFNLCTSVHAMPVLVLLLYQCAKLQLEQRSACTEQCTVNNRTTSAVKDFICMIILNNVWQTRTLLLCLR